MKYFIFFILICFLFFGNDHLICDQETDEKDGNVLEASAMFEIKISKSESKKLILPATIEIKNITPKTIALSGDAKAELYIRIVDEKSSVGAVVEYSGRKPFQLNSEASFNYTFDLYLVLLKSYGKEDLIKKFKEKVKVGVILPGEHRKYYTYSQPIKLADIYDEKLLHEYFPEKELATLSIKVNTQNEIFCSIINNFNEKKRFIKPNFSNFTVNFKYTKKEGGSISSTMPMHYINPNLNQKIGAFEEIDLLPKGSLNVKLPITINDILLKIRDNNSTLDESIPLEIKFLYHETSQGTTCFFFPLESNSINIKLPIEK